MPLPQITIFTANPSTIDKGNSTELIWGTVYAMDVTLTDFGSVALYGHKTVSPSKTKTYYLEASNSEGKVIDDVTVTVTPPSPPPPPPGDTYRMRFNTTPGSCLITLIGITSATSSSTGFMLFENVPAGTIEWTVEKEGYKTLLGTTILDSSKIVTAILEEEPTPPPPPPVECPNFWTDPAGAVLCWILTSIEATLGFVSGGFMQMLADVKTFFEDSWAQIADFFMDVTGAIVEIVKNSIGDIIDWLSDNLIGFAVWISTITADALENLKTFLGDIGDFVATKFTDFVSWLIELTGSIADYISGAIGDFVDWTSEQLGSIWEGIQDWVMDMITGLIDSFQHGFDQGIEDQKNKRKK